MNTPQEVKEIILTELKKINKSANEMINECQLSSSLVSDLGRGRMTSADRLAVIANYLKVSTDYLLGNTDDPTPPGAKLAEEKPARTVRRESISVSFYGGNDDEDLSEEAVEEILDLVQFAREQRRKRNEAKKNKEQK